MRSTWLKLFCVLLFSVTGYTQAWCQDAPSSPSAKETKSPTSTVFGDLVEIGSEIQITPEGGKPLEFDKQPLVIWSNPTRPAAPHGCIFIWNAAGRPQAVGSVFTFVIRNEVRLKHQLHSLSSEPLEATFREQTVWKPTQPGVTWINLPAEISPHDNPRLRLTQMRGIARQYQARLEKPDGSKTQLELKPTPLYRYQSQNAKVVDGAIFSFANGTDPDVLMLLEAYEDDTQKVRWRYAFARFHYWRLVVENNEGAVVWEVEAEPALISMAIGDTSLIGLPYVSYIVDRKPTGE
ncbi:hypothetical protein DTL42_24735 [Bremerella cremea]|uniref:Uncharacterized protein n=1 Tax=Bremerella cremea TaxID=1031537 RepID=A0A368KJ32_9BACT|nr:hypothetical protein [Bremerella cremea]RCS40581.1 hypothetical protein DTL42_24735 [Bremerella cremea]